MPTPEDPWDFSDENGAFETPRLRPEDDDQAETEEAEPDAGPYDFGDEPADEPFERPGFNAKKHLADTQRYLAGAILAILAGATAAIFALLWRGDIRSSDDKDLAVTVFTSIVTLTGSVLGFYFGAHHGQR